MNNLKYGLILLMVTSSFHILAQTTSAQKLKDISIVEVMEKAIFSEDDTLSFENYRVNDPVNDQDTISDGDSFLYYLLLQKHKSKLKLDSVDRIIVPAVLYFGHCQFDNLVCSHFAFREITFFKCEIRDQNNDYDEEFDKSAMVFFDCTFSSNLSIDNVTVENLLIDNTEFKADVEIFNSKIGQHSPDSSCVFTHCSFRANTEIDNNNLGSLVLSKCSFYNYTSITGNSGFEDQYLNISLDSINFFEIKNTVKAKTSVSWLKEFSPVNQFDFWEK